MLPWWVSDFRVLLGILVAIISIYGFVIPRLRKISDLDIRIIECHHCYIEKIKLSRIYVLLYFLNKEERKKIMIKNIKIVDVMGVDLLGTLENVVSDYKNILLEPLKSDKVRIQFNLSDALLKQPVYEINVMITYDNTNKIISTKSMMLQTLCDQ